MKIKKKIKILEIAKRTGYSRKTVSLVVNGHLRGLNKNTANRILLNVPALSDKIEDLSCSSFRDIMDHAIKSYRGKNKVETIKLAARIYALSVELEGIKNGV